MLQRGVILEASLLLSIANIATQSRSTKWFTVVSTFPQPPPGLWMTMEPWDAPLPPGLPPPLHNVSPRSWSLPPKAGVNQLCSPVTTREASIVESKVHGVATEASLPGPDCLSSTLSSPTPHHDAQPDRAPCCCSCHCYHFYLLFDLLFLIVFFPHPFSSLPSSSSSSSIFIAIWFSISSCICISISISLPQL